MRYVMLLMALVLTGCIDVQGDMDRAFAKYDGRPIDDIVAIWGPPIRQGKSNSDIVFMFSGTAASTVGSTSTTTGFIGNTPVTTVTETSTPTTISCRVLVFTDDSRRVVHFRTEGAAGACSRMFRQL